VVGTAVYAADRQNTEDYPSPWRVLEYDTDLGGYIVNLTKDQLQGAPKYGQNDAWDWSNPETSRQIDQYYDRWMY
jgi:hypothetical protein